MIKFDPSKQLGTIVLTNEFNESTATSLSSVALGNLDTSKQIPINSALLLSASGTYFTSDGKVEIDVLPDDQEYFGIEINRGNAVIVERLLSIAGEDSKFWVDDGSSAVDQIEFYIDPISNQMKLIYLKNQAKAPDASPTFELSTFIKR